MKSKSTLKNLVDGFLIGTGAFFWGFVIGSAIIDKIKPKDEEETDDSFDDLGDLPEEVRQLLS